VCDPFGVEAIESYSGVGGGASKMEVVAHGGKGAASVGGEELSCNTRRWEEEEADDGWMKAAEGSQRGIIWRKKGLHAKDPMLRLPFY
jgi:hypothetical protein